VFPLVVGWGALTHQAALNNSKTGKSGRRTCGTTFHPQRTARPYLALALAMQQATSNSSINNKHISNALAHPAFMKNPNMTW
jgi:hypothetical protein